MFPLKDGMDSKDSVLGTKDILASKGRIFRTLLLVTARNVGQMLWLSS
jgi:hypothetical protein